jgi:hypothetical protein
MARGWTARILAFGLLAAVPARGDGLTPSTQQSANEAPATRASPATQSAPAGGLDQDESGLAEFARHFSAHEPIYFLAGTEPPNVKFQFSFKYAVANPEAPLVKSFPALAGVNLAYSQTSLWDTSKESAPFFDNSYRTGASAMAATVAGRGRGGHDLASPMSGGAGSRCLAVFCRVPLHGHADAMCRAAHLRCAGLGRGAGQDFTSPLE